MNFDEAEYPVLMDITLNAAGIPTLDWSYKTDCCGAAFSLTETEVVHKLSLKILREAKAIGADAISVACPLCHANLDMRQTEIEKKYDEKFAMPILYFSQLLGLAMGIEENKLALRSHLVDTQPLLERLAVTRAGSIGTGAAQA